MKNFLLLYSTVDGHTQLICEHIAELLKNNKQYVELMPVYEVDEQDIKKSDCVLVGASIRYGKHRPNVAEFFNQNEALLQSKKTAFFTVNLVARKEEKNTAETSPYMLKFLPQLNTEPEILEVFGGKLNYSIYSFFDKYMIRFIMWVTKGPTDLDTIKDYTDWHKVDKLAERLIKETHQ